MSEVMVRQVPFFNYKIFNDRYSNIILEETRRVIQEGAFIMQKDMLLFEQRIAQYLNVKHALSVANCTDGLIIALQACGIQPGDEVILPSHTFIATAASVQMTGGVPVPIECGADHMIDVTKIEASITDKTRFIMPVQLNGRTCNMDAIQAIAEKHQLTIVEDAAQALGSEFNGKKAGTFGSAAAFSFYPAKILGCLGDGGIVVTNDDAIADKVYELRDHGRNRSGEVVSWGGNSRLDNLQAAILGRIFVEDYENIVRRRREIASLYQSHLGDLSQLVLPPAPGSEPDHFDVFQNYEIEADNRDALAAFLKKNSVGTLIQWGGQAVHQHKSLGFDNVNLPFTDHMTTRYVMLPMNMSIIDDEVEHVSDMIKQFYQG